jgi:hypothetical protein
MIEIKGGPQGVVPLTIVDAAAPVFLPGFVAHWPVVSAAKISDTVFCKYINGFAAPFPLVVYSSIEVINGNIGYKKDFTGFNFQIDSLTLTEVLSQFLRPIDKTI